MATLLAQNCIHPRQAWRQTYKAERNARAGHLEQTEKLLAALVKGMVKRDWRAEAAHARTRYEQHETLLAALLKATTLRQRIILRRRISALMQR